MDSRTYVLCSHPLAACLTYGPRTANRETALEEEQDYGPLPGEELPCDGLEGQLLRPELNSYLRRPTEGTPVSFFHFLQTTTVDSFIENLGGVT